MSTCPKCKSIDSIKGGLVGGRQRYRHTVAYKRYSNEVKQQALKRYLEGLGFRSIAHLLNCSHVAVYQWIKQYGEKACLDLKATEIGVVEMDEMHRYVGSKNTCWLWIADRLGHRFFYIVIDSRDAGQCLGENITYHDIELIMTDHWQPYQVFLTSEIPIQSKAETFTVEGYDSVLRSFLARLHHKSKYYSKSMNMLLYSVMLLMLKRNENLEAIFN